MERVAPKNPTQREYGALEGSVLFYGLPRVLGTRGVINTPRAEQRGYTALIKADAGEQGAGGSGCAMRAAHLKRRLS